VQIFLLILGFSFISSVYAVDATNRSVSDTKYENWRVIEFTMPRQMMYRLASVSINDKSQSITFDLNTHNNCRPDSAILVSENSYASKSSKQGKMIYEYKVPGQTTSVELVNTVIEINDRFEFASFQRLTLPLLLETADKGNLAIWIPASGDGVVKRSENIFFSLRGLTRAYNQARKLCFENR
jgi:hypothetical protein